MVVLVVVVVAVPVLLLLVDAAAVAAAGVAFCFCFLNATSDLTSLQMSAVLWPWELNNIAVARRRRICCCWFGWLWLQTCSISVVAA